MALVTFSAVDCVWFIIKGQRLAPQVDGGPVFGGPLPSVLEDDGLVGRFLTWLRDDGVRLVWIASSGGGVFVGGVERRDAERVRVWLLESGAEEVSP